MENLGRPIKRSVVSNGKIEPLRKALAYYYQFERPLRKRNFSRPMFPDQELKWKRAMQANRIAGEEYYFYRKNFGFFINWSVLLADYEKSKNRFAKILGTLEVGS